LGEFLPGNVGGDNNILHRVTGLRSHAIIAFSYRLLIVFYALTLDPVCWGYAAEVWSLKTRATRMSIAVIGNWPFNSALRLYIPPDFQDISWKLFIAFEIMWILVAVRFLYSETCDKSLLRLLKSCLTLMDRSRGTRTL
jgi:hypothetical protein